jgi:hypothetical protein
MTSVASHEGESMAKACLYRRHAPQPSIDQLRPLSVYAAARELQPATPCVPPASGSRFYGRSCAASVAVTAPLDYGVLSIR